MNLIQIREILDLYMVNIYFLGMNIWSARDREQSRDYFAFCLFRRTPSRLIVSGSETSRGPAPSFAF